MSEYKSLMNSTTYKVNNEYTCKLWSKTIQLCRYYSKYLQYEYPARVSSTSIQYKYPVQVSSTSIQYRYPVPDSSICVPSVYVSGACVLL